MPVLQSRTVHDAAFRELVAVLRSDASLGRVRAWLRHSNEAGDIDREITPADCPAVLLEAVAGSAAERVGTDGLLHTYRVPLGVRIETATTAVPGEGLTLSNALDLSSLIYGAIWPSDRAARAAMDARFRAVGVADVRLVQPILPVDYSDLFIVCRGQVELVQFVDL